MKTAGAIAIMFGASALIGAACRGGGGGDRDKKAGVAAGVGDWGPGAGSGSGAAAAMLMEDQQMAREQMEKLKAERQVARTSAQLEMTTEELEAAGKLGARNMPPTALQVLSGKGTSVAKPGGDDGTESATRAWFPETFLFEPLVVTDATGAATVPVRVPDRLTTWRVLALAHSRSGAQGGAVTSFLSTLPVYVDLVVPPTLMRGDTVRLPVQLVNTTDRAVVTSLTAMVTGARVTGGNGARTIPAQGSTVEYLTVIADRSGPIELKVGLKGGDAVVRTIDVRPLGKPELIVRSGTLAAPRTLTIMGPAGADPATDRVRLQAFPGALALLRSELRGSVARAGVAEDAYALLLGGRASALLTALGDHADPEAVRNLAIVATQRAVRDARALDVDRAALLTEAALAHADSAVLHRLGERAADFLAQSQRPDGTFGGGAGWTLQRVLVATAEATRAVAAADGAATDRQRARSVAIKASGAFERYDGQVADAYTAAALIVSGAVLGPQAERLRVKVRAAIVADTDGARYLDPAKGVVRSDGSVPSRAEATALAALALAGDPASTAVVADLGATLLGSYDPLRGWGDGRANLLCMRAVIELFKTPVSGSVKITLTMDDTPVASGELAADKLRDVLTLEAPAPAAGLAGAHVWKIIADPAVPGLGYALALSSWVPWPSGVRASGLELAAPPTLVAKVGRATDIALHATAPGAVPLHIHYALPAGVQADTPSLEALVTAGVVQKFVTSDGAIDLDLAGLTPGQVVSANFRVVPTLAGTLHSPPSSIAGAGTTVNVPPSTWTVD